MQYIFAVITILIGAYLLSRLAEYLSIPRVVALIIFGLLLRMEPLNTLVIGDSFSTISLLGDIGLLTLMLLAGFKTSPKKLIHETKEALKVSTLGALIPLLMGTIIFYIAGYQPIITLIIGIAMSISAEATTAAVLINAGKAKSRIGALILEAGIIDDILGLAAFVAISFFLRSVHVREDILVSAAIMAFFIGIYIRSHHDGGFAHKKIEEFFMNLLIPFFFVSMGHDFDFRTVLPNIDLLSIMVAVAFAGKFIGVFTAKFFTSLSWLQVHIIGWAMNSRGGIGLALALIAFRSEIIPVEIYSALILMILITTLIFPFAFTYLIKKHPGAMD